IQPGEQPEVAAVLESHGIQPPAFTPLVRGRISHVNGRPVAEFEAPDEEGREELNDEVNLTWASELGPDNSIVAGRWWSGVPASPELSLEEGILEETGLSLGDEVTYV